MGGEPSSWAGVGARFPLVFVLGLFSLPKAQVLVDSCPLFSTPVSDDLGLAHRLRKTFTVPELLISATAAALVTPGAGGWGVGGPVCNEEGAPQDLVGALCSSLPV